VADDIKEPALPTGRVDLGGYQLYPGVARHERRKINDRQGRKVVVHRVSI